MEEAQLVIQEQIAFDLRRRFGPDFEFAWVTHQNKTYFAKHPKNRVGPASPTVKLIQFLFDDFVDQSFFILRNRIFCTSALTSMCEGMVQLAAKRASGGISAKDHALSHSFDFLELGADSFYLSQTKHEVLVEWKAPTQVDDPIEAYFHLQELIAKIPRGEVLHDFNRPIAALICDGNGKVLSWAVNNNSKNKTLHAEVVAILKYFKAHQCKLPAKTRVYTSLKPCRMCAAMLIEMSEDPNGLNAIYFQDDPGPLAKNTELEKRKLMKQYLLHDAGQRP